MTVIATYSPPVDRLLTLGHLQSRRTARFLPDDVVWPDYPAELGLSQQDSAELIRMLKDISLDQQSSETAWARVHAYRALGQLKAKAAGSVMIEALDVAIRTGDKRARMEIPDAMAMLGASIRQELLDHLSDMSRDSYVQATIASLLADIARSSAKDRSVCTAAIINLLKRGPENDPRLNSALILSLKIIDETKETALINQVCAEGWADTQMLRFALQDSTQTPL